MIGRNMLLRILFVNKVKVSFHPVAGHTGSEGE